MKQSEIIRQLSDSELKRQLVLSQLLLFFLSLIMSWFLFEKMSDWLLYFTWNANDIFYYGVIPGLIIVIIDLLLIFIFPKKYYDDGGINERVFKNQSVFHIFCILCTS